MQNRSLLGDQSRNTNKESNAFTNDRSTFTQAEGHSYSRDPNEILAGGSLMNEITRMCRDEFKKIDGVIKRWQIYDSMKCVHENAVNAMQESVLVDFYPDEGHLLNYRESSFFLENEAVRTAIEGKGLKLYDHCHDEERFERTHYYNLDDDDDNNDDDDDDVDHCCYPTSKREYISADYDVEIEKADYEIQENNFETNFLAAAVSSAIEMIGLAHEGNS